MTRNFEDERERWEYDFGRRLNMLRENAGMRYEDLAKAAGIGTTMTWRYLTGASEPTGLRPAQPGARAGHERRRAAGARPRGR
ncbi:MAG: helix-turn-helix transcriptional regulator [Kiritimatiellae bacterium]|nr:helix-turn-helix transcriptional regulator [Kiritimatiellia bacterium]